MKGRRHLHLDLDILKDMEESGIDISAWASNEWIESSYSIDCIKKKISVTEEKLAHLKDILKRNTEFEKQLNKLTDSKEITFFKETVAILKRVENDLSKQEQLICARINLYHGYFKIRLSKSMFKKKIEIYKKQYN